MRDAEYGAKMIKVIINRTLLILFYFAIVLGLGFGGYYLYLTNYDFYFEKEDYELLIGDVETVKITTTKPFDVKEGDYIFTIKDPKVAGVSKNGIVNGVNIGTTELEVRYKFSIFPKTVKIRVVPDESETHYDNNGNSTSDSSSGNGNTVISDDGGELELPF